MAAALREARISLYRVRSVRVRGTTGRLFTSRRGRTTFYTYVWKEKGAIYQAGTTTAKTVSLKAVQSFIKGLEPLEREWFASSCNEGVCQGVTVVTTRSTASVHFDWETTCDGGSGEAAFNLVRRSGNNFSLSLLPGPGQPWTVTGNGIVRPDGVSVNVRASGAPRGAACDTGPLAFDANRRYEN